MLIVGRAFLMVPDFRRPLLIVGIDSCSLSFVVAVGFGRLLIVASIVVGILVAGVTGGLRCVNFTNTVLMRVQNVRVFCIAHCCICSTGICAVAHSYCICILSGCSHKNSTCYFPVF